MKSQRVTMRQISRQMRRKRRRSNRSPYKESTQMLNRIFLIGHLGRDPEMSFTPSGKALTKFSLAVNRPSRGSKEGGERQEETDWFNIVTWDRLAEICNNSLRKGSKVFIEGRIESRKYTDKNGVERTAWDVTANDLRFL